MAFGKRKETEVNANSTELQEENTMYETEGNSDEYIDDGNLYGNENDEAVDNGLYSDNDKVENTDGTSESEPELSEDDLWYNTDTEDVEEADDSEFDMDCFYIQDGVYADMTNNTVYVEKDVLKYIVKGNSRYY